MSPRPWSSTKRPSPWVAVFCWILPGKNLPAEGAFFGLFFPGKVFAVALGVTHEKVTVLAGTSHRCVRRSRQAVNDLSVRIPSGERRHGERRSGVGRRV